LFKLAIEAAEIGVFRESQLSQSNAFWQTPEK
jgi:hypothetical protein